MASLPVRATRDELSLSVCLAQGPGQRGVVSAGHGRRGGGRGSPDPLHLNPGLLLRERHQHPAGEQHEAAGGNTGRGEDRRGAHGPALCSGYCKCLYSSHTAARFPFRDLVPPSPHPLKASFTFARTCMELLQASLLCKFSLSKHLLRPSPLLSCRILSRPRGRTRRSAK